MWRYVAPCGKSHVPCFTEHVSLSRLGLSMANVSQKNGVFHVRFRYAGKQYKKSLRTRDPAAAQAACHLVELTIYRLTTGQLLSLLIIPSAFTGKELRHLPLREGGWLQ